VSPQKINRLTVLLLALGLGSALAIYVLAAPAATDPMRDDPLRQKRYNRELAMYGGKANVVSAELIDWFGGLWQGRALAGTVAALTLGGAWLFRIVATPPAAATEPPEPPARS